VSGKVERGYTVHACLDANSKLTRPLAWFVALKGQP